MVSKKKPTFPSLLDQQVSWLINDGCWDIARLEEHFCPFLKNDILTILLASVPADDKWVCAHSRNGRAKPSSVYRFIRQPEDYQPPRRDWCLIWKLEVLPKIKIFLWLEILSWRSSIWGIPDLEAYREPG